MYEADGRWFDDWEDTPFLLELFGYRSFRRKVWNWERTDYYWEYSE